MLSAIDPRLMHHGEQVAWITRKIVEQGHLEYRFNMQILFLLSLLHDMGAYRTEETNDILQFEAVNVRNHALYGYLFLKYLSPLKKSAEAIRYHHTPYKMLEQSGSAWSEYAALIFFADRADILLMTGNPDFSKLAPLVPDTLSAEYYTLFSQINAGCSIENAVASGTYLADIDRWTEQLDFTPEEAFQLLEMMIFLLDFHSPATVTHTINTAAFAVSLGKRTGCSRTELNELFTAGLLHDIGKFGIPVEILEFPGKLDRKQTEIMQTHVVKTEKLIRGIVQDKIVDIAVRHHEKLDGTGYPRKLTSSDLTLQQRILAVADILSALTGTRSYKTPFSKEKTLRILESMTASGGLDASVTGAVSGDYDTIMKEIGTGQQELIAISRHIREEFTELSSDPE